MAAGINGPAMDARHQRVSRNEAVYRAVNREIEQVSEELGEGPQDQLTVICECGQEDCAQTIDLTHAEYEDAHEQRDRFVVAPGHEDEQLEHVVKRDKRYLVVDKFGEAERITQAEERREGIQ
jgi:diaminopimelate decarboxylase